MSMTQQSDETAPTLVALLGWLGLLPFLVPPVAAVIEPGLGRGLIQAQTIYAGLILSFLGGSRWGQAVQAATPDGVVVSIAMLPTIVALGLLAAPSLSPDLRIGGLAFALVVHWLWDIATVRQPRWYAKLRTTLSIAAVIGLTASIVLLNIYVR